MKFRTMGLLAAVTLCLSSMASRELVAKDAKDASKSRCSSKATISLSDKPATEIGTDESKPALKKVAKKRPRMDLAFCIDTTGSMGGELEMVKEKVKELVAKLASGKPTPDIRVGLVAYRDRGDIYVTKEYEFTDDIDKFVKDISSLKAQGGGDTLESVNEALHASVTKLDWDKSNKAAKLLFLIGDAGPNKYPDDFDWKTESQNAIARGIQINTIGCDGLSGGVKTFKEIAKLADGKFEFLSYRQEVARADGSRATVVRSGGEAYMLSDAAASSGEWKKGAKALIKAKMARKVTTSRSSGPMGADMSAMAGGGFARAAADGELPAAPAAMPAPDRRENNLDSILTEAALKKAEKSLKVKYEK